MPEYAIREMMIPDPGKVFIEGDLQRADAHVVAWEAEDDSLKTLFRSGKDIHIQNARDIYGINDSECLNAPDYAFIASDPRSTSRLVDLRDKRAKNGVHAVNYGVRARTLSSTLSSTIKDAEGFIEGWMTAHPGVRRWHNRILHELRTRRYVTNKWGFRRSYTTDDPDLILPQALAWIGQSTVGITINKAMVAIDTFDPGMKYIEQLLQVHDSLLMQIDESNLDLLAPQIKSLMTIPIPYTDPLTIPVTLKYSRTSWEHMEDLC